MGQRSRGQDRDYLSRQIYAYSDEAIDVLLRLDAQFKALGPDVSLDVPLKPLRAQPRPQELPHRRRQ